MDIVTGGASAVYGSDAVSGVVNFVTDRNYNGLKFDSQYGISALNDGREVKLGIAGGMPLFGGRGHLEGSFEYFDAPGIFDKLSRDFGRKAWTMQGSGTTANPYRLVQNTRLNATSFLGNIPLAGNVAANPLRDMIFSSNGVLTPFRHGTPTGSSAVESGGDGGYFYNASLEGLYSSRLGFARFDFDLTDNTHFFTQFSSMWAHNKNNHESNEFRNINIARDNAFLSPTYQAQLQAANVNSFVFSKMFTRSLRSSPMPSPTATGARWAWKASWASGAGTRRT